jgi:Bacterial Ig domain
VTLKTPGSHTARLGLTAVLGLLAIALVPSALAGPPGGGGGKGGKTCTRNAPGVAVDNTWAWSQTGSWGMPGQQLGYAVKVVNYDVGCSASSFVVRLSAPDAFSVSLPTDTVSLGASQTGSLWAHVTSPSSVTDGNYALSVTVVRAGTSSPTGSYTSSYKVYSADSTAPTLFWATPAAGSNVTGRSYTMSVSANDDHAVRKLELRLDGASMTTTTCDNVSYTCRLYYSWAVTPGAHTATYTATDWMGNVATTTVNFTA